jgi:hypothetical protein
MTRVTLDDLAASFTLALAIQVCDVVARKRGCSRSRHVDSPEYARGPRYNTAKSRRGEAR